MPTRKRKSGSRKPRTARTVRGKSNSKTKGARKFYLGGKVY